METSTASRRSDSDATNTSPPCDTHESTEHEDKELASSSVVDSSVLLVVWGVVADAALRALRVLCALRVHGALVRLVAVVVDVSSLLL